MRGWLACLVGSVVLLAVVAPEVARAQARPPGFMVGIDRLPVGVIDTHSAGDPGVRSRYVRIDGPAMVAAMDQAHDGTVIIFPLFPDEMPQFTMTRMPPMRGDFPAFESWSGRMDGDDRAVAIIVMSIENGSFTARLQASGRTYGLDQVNDDIYVIRQLEAKGNLNNDTVAAGPVTTLPSDRPRAAFTG